MRLHATSGAWYDADIIMTEDEYRRHEASIFKRHTERLGKIADELNQDLAALRRLWMLANPLAPWPLSRLSGTWRNPIEYEVLRIVLQTMRPGEPFTIRDVMAEVKERHSRTAHLYKQVSVSAVLQRAAERGELEVVSAGKGKRATTYRIPDTSGNWASHQEFRKGPVLLEGQEGGDFNFEQLQAARADRARKRQQRQQQSKEKPHEQSTDEGNPEMEKS